MLHHGYIHWVSHERRGSRVSAAMAAAPARRKYMCLQSLWLLQASSSFLLSPCLPWVQQTVCTVRYSKTIGVMNRISDQQPTRLLCPWDSPGKNIGVSCHSLLQGIFLTQGLNPHLLCLLHWRRIFISESPGKHRQIHRQTYRWLRTKLSTTVNGINFNRSI